MTLIVSNWVGRFEDSNSRVLKRLGYVQMSTQLDHDGELQLMMDHDEGPAHYAAYVRIVILAATCTPRGALVKENGQPHDAGSLSRQIRLSHPVVVLAIERMLAVGIGLLIEGTDEDVAKMLAEQNDIIAKEQERKNAHKASRSAPSKKLRKPARNQPESVLDEMEREGSGSALPLQSRPLHQNRTELNRTEPEGTKQKPTEPNEARTGPTPGNLVLVRTAKDKPFADPRSVGSSVGRVLDDSVGSVGKEKQPGVNDEAFALLADRISKFNDEKRLSDVGFLLGMFNAFVATGKFDLPDNLKSQKEFVAAAFRAKDNATESPVGWFLSVVRRGLWTHSNNAEEIAAEAAIVKHKRQMEEFQRRSNQTGQAPQQAVAAAR